MNARAGLTCVLHPDTGRFARPRDLSAEEWARLAELERRAQTERVHVKPVDRHEEKP